MDIEKTKKFVEQFIYEFKKMYPSVKIDYIYDEELDFFDICHNDKTLQFENEEFLKNIGILIKEKLYANEIFNVSFNYDNTKDTEFITKDNLNDLISSITTKYSNSVKCYSFISKANNFMSEIDNAAVVHNSDLDINSKYNFITNENYSLFENKFLYKTTIIGKSEEGLAA